MSTTPLNIVIFLGTVREGRMGLRVAKFMEKQLKSKSFNVDLFDAKEMPVPMIAMPLHHYRDRSMAPQWLIEADKKLQSADGFVVITGEYNHGIPPALANLLDHFPPSSVSYKPSAIVSYSMGQYGGMRAAMPLRCLLAELGCISVSNIFGIPKVHEAFDDSGKPMNDHMQSGAQRLLTQLEWHAMAMRNHRTTYGVPK